MRPLMRLFDLYWDGWYRRAKARAWQDPEWAEIQRRRIVDGEPGSMRLFDDDRGLTMAGLGQRLVWAGEVVVHVVQRDGVSEVLDLLGEPVGQAGEPAHPHPHGEVLPGAADRAERRRACVTKQLDPSAVTDRSDDEETTWMDDRPARARDLGIVPGRFSTGERNLIVDVDGVRVGQVTINDGDGLCTGVTAVVPDAVDRAGGRLSAGLFVGNGYGKLIGATQLAELGTLETPILLTGTLSAFRTADALVSYLLAMPGNEDLESVNPVVGETNDGFLSDIRRRPVTEEHVYQALASASADAVAEGCVGAGTGTGTLGFKGGIGTSSRMVEVSGYGACTVGVLLQSNFSGTLSVLGVPIRKQEALGSRSPHAPPRGNSCMIVVAVDCGLDARQLTRVARRAVFGMARAGSDFAECSGDYAIAFTVDPPSAVPDSALDPIFAGVQEAVEEAVLNSLFMAETTVGYHGHTKYAVPRRFVLERCGAAGVLKR